MNKNQIDNKRNKIEVKCLDLNDLGEGIFKVNNSQTLASVANFLPKEIGLVEETNFGRQKKYKLLKVLKASNIRIEPKCEIYKRCGSCHLLHMNYENQMKFKFDYVTNAFKECKLNPKIDEVVLATKLEHYRNKMQVAYTYYQNDIVYGFYEEESHRIIPLSNCLVQSEKQNEIVKTIAKIMKEMRLLPYNEERRNGLIRFVCIREAVKKNEMLVTVVTNGDIFPGRSEFVKRLRTRCPYITTLVQNVNTRKTSIILGDDERILFGNGYITDELCGIEFKISSKTFYQINPYQTESLYNKVIEYITPSGNEIVLDAYCGVGTIGLVVSPKVKQVIGVESNKQSVLNARDNAFANKIKNIRFINDDATEYLSKMKDEKMKFDVVIMDPPRSGSTVKFLQALKEIKPTKIIYVSCEAKTLARDLKELIDSYEITKKCIVDMFVGTYHIETVVQLIRK